MSCKADLGLRGTLRQVHGQTPSGDLRRSERGSSLILATPPLLTPPTVAKRQQASQELAGSVPQSLANTRPLAEPGALSTSSASAEARGRHQERVALLRNHSLGACKLHLAILREEARALGRTQGLDTKQCAIVVAP